MSARRDDFAPPWPGKRPAARAGLGRSLLPALDGAARAARFSPEHLDPAHRASHHRTAGGLAGAYMVFLTPMQHDMQEKRIRTLPALRVDETLETGLMRLAAADGRVLSDYCRRVLELHVYGHAYMLDAAAPCCKLSRAGHCDA